jgi:hypothetical protein
MANLSLLVSSQPGALSCTLEEVTSLTLPRITARCLSLPSGRCVRSPRYPLDVYGLVLRCGLVVDSIEVSTRCEWSIEYSKSYRKGDFIMSDIRLSSSSHSSKPSSLACLTACTRFCTPSLEKIWLTWRLTVSTTITSSWAISRLDAPRQETPRRPEGCL